jgi:hypothetical protein
MIGGVIDDTMEVKFDRPDSSIVADYGNADLSQPVSPRPLAFRRSSNPKRSQTKGRAESVALAAR